MAFTLVIAEKPSVARDIARVLGCKEAQGGFYQGDAHRVTWAIGHLVSLAEPEEIDEKWKKWRKADLPILPESLPLRVLPKTKEQYTIVKRLMNAKDCDGLICATDAGREGELIFRYIYRMAGCKKPVMRLWISNMMDEAIREGLSAIKPAAAYDSLYESARCRSEADWLVGMNASRAFTLRYDALLSIGRVQTPTLALLVRRHHEITSFVPEAYWTVTADFGQYTGTWFNEQTKEKRLHSGSEAEAVAAKVRGKGATVESVVKEEKSEMPPYLYDLTSLQRDANRLLGFTAQKTLSVAQKLYEEHKLLTYPRTDSRHLPKAMVGKVKGAMERLPDAYANLFAPLLSKERLPMPRRIFDDAKVTDHHAIIPTGKKADLGKLPEDDRALFDLVVRRFLAAFYPDYLYHAVRVLTRAEGEAFVSLGREVGQIGWKAVYADGPSAKSKKIEEDEEARALPSLADGDAKTVEKVVAKEDKTKPPPPYTDASLLSAMENAGRSLDDDTLRESMKGSGLGTPATRAAMIERLIAVGYTSRRGRAIQATEKGVKLIAVVPEALASPETTGRWEKALSDIAAGEMEPNGFLSGIRDLAVQLVKDAENGRQDVVFESDPSRKKRSSQRKSAAIGAACPLCGEGEVLENSKAFFCSRWKDGCKLTVWKNCCEASGGPTLTAVLAARAIKEGKLKGSTGTIMLESGQLRFYPLKE